MFKILDEACKPQRATKHSACIDLYAREDTIIGAGETKIIPQKSNTDVTAERKSDILLKGKS